MIEQEPARPGLEVYTADDRLLGSVGELRGEYFSLLPDNPNERKYWLPLSRVASTTSAERVAVDFDFVELEDKKAGSEGE